MKIGDRVCIRETGYAGEVGEIAGNIVYVDMDNGVEMEMKIGDLILESEYETQATVKRQAIKDRDNEAQAVLDALNEKFIELSKTVQQKASMAVMAIGGSSGDWDELTPMQKLNFVSVATGVSVDNWIEWNQKGTIATLQLIALANIGSRMKD